MFIKSGIEYTDNKKNKGNIWVIYGGIKYYLPFRFMNMGVRIEPKEILSSDLYKELTREFDMDILSEQQLDATLDDLNLLLEDALKWAYIYKLEYKVVKNVIFH